MNNKERIRQKAEARLQRLPANSGHARILRAKLGITDAPAPEPVVEPAVEEVKPKATRKRKPKTDSK